MSHHCLARLSSIALAACAIFLSLMRYAMLMAASAYFLAYVT